MGIFSDILLTVDFDRTLTAPDGTIPAANLAAIRYFMANGGAFTVNTGRSVPMYRRRFGAVPVNAPLLLYNGSAAWENGRLCLEKPIDLPMWDTLTELADVFPDLHVELQGVNAHYRVGRNRDWDRFCDSLGCDHGVAAPDCDPAPFLKFALIGEIRAYNIDHLFRGAPAELARLDGVEDYLRRRWPGKLEVVRSAPRLIDVQAAGVNKAVSARALQARLGRKWCVCVGDGENDLAMLSGADISFCPADGALADRFPTVCRCADGAVAEVIYKKLPEILRGNLDKKLELC